MYLKQMVDHGMAGLEEAAHESFVRAGRGCIVVNIKEGESKANYIPFSNLKSLPTELQSDGLSASVSRYLPNLSWVILLVIDGRPEATAVGMIANKGISGIQRGIVRTIGGECLLNTAHVFAEVA